MQERRVGSLGWEDPLRRKWQPAPVCSPRCFQGRGAWQAAVHAVTDCDVAERARWWRTRHRAPSALLSAQLRRAERLPSATRQASRTCRLVALKPSSRVSAPLRLQLPVADVPLGFCEFDHVRCPAGGHVCLLVLLHLAGFARHDALSFIHVRDHSHSTCGPGLPSFSRLDNTPFSPF